MCFTRNSYRAGWQLHSGEREHNNALGGSRLPQARSKSAPAQQLQSQQLLVAVLSIHSSGGGAASTSAAAAVAVQQQYKQQ